MNDELKKVMEVAEVWTKEPFDAETRAQVKAMMDAEDKTELIDSFYRTLFCNSLASLIRPASPPDSVGAL